MGTGGFTPGHDVHPVQARLAFESDDGVEMGSLVRVADDEIVVILELGERHYRSARALDAAAHLDQAIREPGGWLVFVNESRGVLALPVGDAGAAPPTTMGLRGEVAELADGAAVAIATTEEGWWARLYGIEII